MRQLTATSPLRPMPLAVLAHGRPFALPKDPALSQGFTSEEIEPLLFAANQAQAELVPDARFFHANESGHDIHQDQPALITEAIRQVVAGVRSPDTWYELTAAASPEALGPRAESRNWSSAQPANVNASPGLAASGATLSTETAEPRDIAAAGTSRCRDFSTASALAAPTAPGSGDRAVQPVAEGRNSGLEAEPARRGLRRAVSDCAVSSASAWAVRDGVRFRRRAVASVTRTAAGTTPVALRFENGSLSGWQTVPRGGVTRSTR